ncbi:Z1 domain-containing protein [Spiroplasma endosymbiont of Amphibalanus improvisus]|uniref:Z1 domain-containing protein n=1 Tax=Spiroplasma endosymbiont of Amphibalanus improvisus TaxID=3066327 RepID=UPI00313ED4C2
MPVDKFMNNFKLKIKNINKLNDENIDEILQNSLEIKKKINYKIQNNISNPTGLIIGKIQSGKTLNFLALISVLFDDDYKIAIVIGGVDKTLFEQNKKRIHDVFGDDDQVTILSLNKETESNAGKYDKVLKIKKKNIIIPCLKNNNHIIWLLNFLEKTELIRKQKIIIIDDEGDQFSPDGNKNNNKVNNTSIFSNIRNIRNILPHHIFLSVTATAQLNISLLKDYKDHLRPDFYHLTKPGKNYAGLEEFHNENSFKYIKLIEDPNDKKSIIDAFHYFLIISSKYAYDTKDRNTICSMLIHEDVKTNEHRRTNEILKERINEITNLLEIKENNDLEKKNLNSVLNIPFKEIFGRNLNLLNEQDNEIFKILEDRIHFTNSQIINGKSKNNFEGDDLNLIYIGGNLLQRGVTIDKLIIIYITRRGKSKSNADTTLQRARWFGYRNSLLNYMKIFMSNEIYNDFSILARDEKKRWGVLEVNDPYFENEDSLDDLIEDYRFSLDQNSKMIPHRANAGNFQKNIKEKSNSWLWQTHYYPDNPNEINELDNLVKISNNQNYTNSRIHKEITFKNYHNFKIKYPSIWKALIFKLNVNEKEFDRIITETDNELKVIKIRHNDNKDNFRTQKNIISLSTGLSAQYIGDNNLHKHPLNTDKNLILLYELFIKNKNGEEIHPSAIYYASFTRAKSKSDNFKIKNLTNNI